MRGTQIPARGMAAWAGCFSVPIPCTHQANPSIPLHPLTPPEPYQLVALPENVAGEDPAGLVYYCLLQDVVTAGGGGCVQKHLEREGRGTSQIRLPGQSPTTACPHLLLPGDEVGVRGSRGRGGDTQEANLLGYTYLPGVSTLGVHLPRIPKVHGVLLQLQAAAGEIVVLDAIKVPTQTAYPFLPGEGRSRETQWPA